MSAQVSPLRVAVVASSLNLGGAEKQTVYISRALWEAGIDVRLFYLGGGGHYESVLQQIGVPTDRIYRANRPWVILAGLIRALRHMRPHIVLMNQFGDLAYGIIAGWCCRALTLGGIRSDGLYELNVRGKLGPWLFRLGHGFIANSYRAKQSLICRGIKGSKIEVLSNVIDLQDFDAQSALPSGISLPVKRVIVAAVGSLQGCKRFDRFIDALALARHREPTLFGVIAGADRGAKAALEERAKALGLVPHYLKFLGEVDRIPALLSRADMLVLSSDYEGFPNVILEAMGARLPVITTPAGDAALVVQHGKTGYVVEPQDVQGMAAFMVQLARAASMRKNFGEAGRKRVEELYSYESLSDRVTAIFQNFAARSRRNSLREMLQRRAPAKRHETLVSPWAVGTSVT